jgi:hypothetical protein
VLLQVHLLDLVRHHRGQLHLGDALESRVQLQVLATWVGRSRRVFGGQSTCYEEVTGLHEPPTGQDVEDGIYLGAVGSRGTDQSPVFWIIMLLHQPGVGLTGVARLISGVSHQ